MTASLTPEELDRIEAHLRAHLVNPFWLSEAQQANMDVVLRLIAAIREAWLAEAEAEAERDVANLRLRELGAEMAILAAERDRLRDEKNAMGAEMGKWRDQVFYIETQLAERGIVLLRARAKGGDSG